MSEESKTLKVGDIITIPVYPLKRRWWQRKRYGGGTLRVIAVAHSTEERE